MVNVEEILNQFEQLMKTTPPNSAPLTEEHELVILQDKEYRRLKSTIDLNQALRIYHYKWYVHYLYFKC